MGNGEQRSGGKKGKEKKVRAASFRCGCSPGFLSSLNSEDNERLEGLGFVSYGCIGAALLSPGMCQVFINAL